MVANGGRSEDTLHMRGWGLEASSLYFNPTYSLGSYNMQGPGGGAIRKLSLPWQGPSLGETWGCDRRTQALVLVQPSHFLAVACWANQPISGKRCRKRSLSQVEGVGRFGELWVGKQKGKA